MQKKWVVLTNVLALVAVIALVVLVVWNFSFAEEEKAEECVEVNKVASFVYDACYDAYSKNIFIEVKRSYDIYRLRAITFSFFDFSERSYTITDIPLTNGSKAYKVSAEKNPQNLDVSLDVVKDFSSPVCPEPRRIFVRYCPSGISQDGVNVTVSPLEDVELEEFIQVGKSSRQDSDILSLNLVEKERIWKSQCESSWTCGDWEDCIDGIQKRECTDSRDCFIPTDVPATSQYCDGGCVESWECEWSDCIGGFTVPKCVDKNECGTEFDIPQKLECNFGDCIPNVVCGEWSDCSIDYNFMDLVEGGIQNLAGVKSRICKDENSCVNPVEETRKCSMSLDVYTKRFTKCGSDFVGIYNRLNNELIARIEEGKGDEPFLNVHLDDFEDSPYCDYCFDGVMNGDESGVDCGGSCEACADKYTRTTFKKKTWMDNTLDWFKRALT
jgi:hypothetical protein